jgi:hypothetical protein
MQHLAILNDNPEILEDMLTNEGEPLLKLTYQSPVLLVFLRHFGCVFCKEALHDLAKRQLYFQENHIRLVFVHMADDATSKAYFSNFHFENPVYICDPGQRYYAAFGLQRGSFRQLYGLQTWIRGYQVKKEHGFELELAQKLGDSTQMPGVFVIQDGKIRESFVHRYAAERPDYDRLVQCCIF